VSRLSRQCGILNISQPYRPPWPVAGIALLYFYLNLRHCTANYRPVSSDRTPYMKKKENNCRSKKCNICSPVPKGARHQDDMADWPTDRRSQYKLNLKLDSRRTNVILKIEVIPFFEMSVPLSLRHWVAHLTWQLSPCCCVLSVWCCAREIRFCHGVTHFSCSIVFAVFVTRRIVTFLYN
jgi:hypothetical protein